MKSRIPFVGRIFWPVLAVVVVLVVGGWILIPRFTDYQIEPQDYGGSTISGLILAYLIHLWLLPIEPPSPQDEGDSPPA